MATFLLIAWLGLIAFLIWVNASGRPVRDRLDAEGLSESAQEG